MFNVGSIQQGAAPIKGTSVADAIGNLGGLCGGGEGTYSRAADSF